MRAVTVARNYAEALFELGERSGNTDRYVDLIDAVAAALETTPRLQVVLMSPRVSKTEKARLFSAADLRDRCLRVGGQRVGHGLHGDG